MIHNTNLPFPFPLPYLFKKMYAIHKQFNFRISLSFNIKNVTNKYPYKLILLQIQWFTSLNNIIIYCCAIWVS